MKNNYLGDLLTRIKNGYRARLSVISLHFLTPKYCIKILYILEKEGYIAYFEESLDLVSQKKIWNVYLKYNVYGAPTISNVYQISKPGSRVYLSLKSLWKTKSFTGLFILSTSRGFLTDREARLLNVGGEVLLCIY